jgi:hypothetical protein
MTATTELFTPTLVSLTASNNGTVAKTSANVGLQTAISVTKIAGSDSLIDQGDYATYEYNVSHPYGITK